MGIPNMSKENIALQAPSFLRPPSSSKAFTMSATTTVCSSPRVYRPCQRPGLARQRSSSHMRQRRACAHFRAAVHATMYCSRVLRHVVKKAATQEAEKPALPSTAAEKAAALEVKKAAQLNLAEESLRSMQSPNHKALSAWETSDSV